MKIHELNVTRNKSSRRSGRGISAGRGKTAGRGTKGQSSRSGGKVRPGFEGGQNPLYMRLPKLPGFKSHRPKAQNIYTFQLDAFSGKTVDNFKLAEAGLISDPYQKVKLIHKGEITKKVTVKLQAASENAKNALQKAGGSFEKTPRPQRPAKSKKAKTATS